MITRLRDKGQVTIPSDIREQLRLSKDALLSIARVGDAILIAPQPSRFEEVAKRFEARAKKEGITLGDLLKELRQMRRRAS
jgi:AbrB family looped-hinge helix DNA binding protein